MHEKQQQTKPLRRIDRLKAPRPEMVRAVSSARLRAPSPPLKAPVSVLVLPSLPEGRLSSADAQVIGLARRLQELHFPGTSVAVAVFGAVPEGLDAGGADRVFVFPEREDDPLCDAGAETLAALITRVAPRYALAAHRPGADRAMTLSLAARLEAGFAAKVHFVDEASLTFRSATDEPEVSLTAPLPMLNEILPGCGEPWHGAKRDLRLETLPLELSRFAATDLGELAGTRARASLSEAEFIVSAGDGVADLGLFEQLVKRLGAAPGASRVLVDAGKAPRERQVGSSGTLVRARVYVAIGISGAPQHLLGIEDCDYVIAINRDPNCAMVRRADLAIIADAGEVMRSVLEHCNTAQGAVDEHT